MYIYNTYDIFVVISKIRDEQQHSVVSFFLFRKGPSAWRSWKTDQAVECGFKG